MDAAAISSSFRQKWSELQKLLERQRSKGGIIDPEVESNRFLIHINEVRGGDGSVGWVISFVDPGASRLLRLLLKMEARMLTGPPPPPDPHWACPTAEAVRPTGTTREEAGPGHSPGEAPPSQRT